MNFNTFICVFILWEINDDVCGSTHVSLLYDYPETFKIFRDALEEIVGARLAPIEKREKN
ncbi:hypothetical protein A3K80_04650 [Candidatus Bathyarchaeota archaeon RBG_13_38_9]|nr:MAG: hypothetical protein A3K80_04650 [Candidatus Bathyarchaeota archaeon RBG_13_38_9]